MTDRQATQSQLSFTRKLRNASHERDEISQRSLKEKGKSDASALIDKMKNVKILGSDGETPWEEVFATGKQITFLARLQDSDERKDAAKKYLSESRKYSINALSMHEASELIDILAGMKGVGPEIPRVLRRQVSSCNS
jgi:hypothetical protein